MLRKNAIYWSVLLGGALVIVYPGMGMAQNADNTKINERDRMDAAPTADVQGQSKSDLRITQEVRKAILSNKSLSTNAHNVKIIAQDGIVILKGPVDSTEEMKAVYDAAVSVVGPGVVQSQMDVVIK